MFYCSHLADYELFLLAMLRNSPKNAPQAAGKSILSISVTLETIELSLPSDFLDIYFK
jgi:hypothetical protein